MPNKRECNFTVRQWTPYDEMIVAMYQDAHHGLCTEAIIGNRITDCEMVHHPSLFGR